ncbi:TPA: hypothetical protein EYP38_01795, partial [Candidatus Micrarchaeota archaeon]|nr:hypothetical protein [Candidatus Micrarchaeota archaeon]
MKEAKPWAILLAILLAASVFFLELPIREQAHTVLVITVLMGVLWFTAAIPLYITALLGTFLLITFAQVGPKDAFHPYFSPTIVLFFGG